MNERTIGSLLGYSQATISGLLNGHIEFLRNFHWSQLYSLLNRFSAPEIDINAALKRGEHPTLWLLDILADRGFNVSLDHRIPLRTFYVPEGSCMAHGRVVSPYYLSRRSPPVELAASVVVTEIPSGDDILVTYSGENIDDLSGYFSTSSLALNRGAKSILKILNI